MPILNMIAQGGGGGGNVGEPTNLSAVVTSASSIDITWTDNNLQALPPSTFQKSVLVRRVGSTPTTPSDGTTVVTETVMNTYQSSAYSDTGLTDGTTYYYQVFSYSTDGGITYGTPVSATPQSGGWHPGVNTIAYYPLEGDADDYSGNGYNGTPSNVTYTTLASGIEVATFNGSAKISIADPLVNNKTAFTISVRCYDTTTSFGNVFNNQSSAYNGVFVDSINGQQIRAGIGGMAYTVDLSPISLNTWHNIVCVYDNGTFMVYANGTYLGTDTHVYDNGINMTIGAWEAQNRYWTGYISKVIFEDKARTAQEIADYYNQTKANYGL